MSASELATDAILLAAAVVAGFANAIAGGASLIGLPVLVATGVPPAVANATNNVATTFQSIFAVWAFARRGHHDWPTLRRVALPALLGAWIGAQLVIELPDRVFTRIVGALMILAVVLVVFAPRSRGGSQPPPNTRYGAVAILVFGGLGVYGGFFGGGVGLVVLPALVYFFGLDFIAANGVKAGVGAIMNSTAFVVFLLGDLIWWRQAAVMTLGMVLGSELGVRLAVRVGPLWVKRAVAIIGTTAAAWFLVGEP